MWYRFVTKWKLAKAAIYKAGIAYRQTSSDCIEVVIKGDEKEAKEMKEKGFEDEDEQRHESVEGDDQSNRRSRKKKKSSKVFIDGIFRLYGPILGMVSCVGWVEAWRAHCLFQAFNNQQGNIR